MILVEWTADGLDQRSPRPPARLASQLRAGVRPSGALALGYAIERGEVLLPDERHVPFWVTVTPDDGDDGAPPRLMPPAAGLATLLAWRGEWLEAVTDTAGAHPLYVHESGKRLLVGSDAFDVARAAGVTELDPAACMGLLAYEFVPGHDTLLRGVRELPAGSRVRWRWRGGCLETETETHWRWEPRAEENLTLRDAAEAAAANLRECAAPVAAHIRRTQGRLAVNLSGGWSSRAVLAAAAAGLAPGQLVPCSYGVDAHDGIAYARQCCESLGLEHHYRSFPGGRILADLFDDLCRTLPPVVRFNAGDGALWMGRAYCGGVTAATGGHGGATATDAPLDPAHAPASGDALAKWIARRYQSSLRRGDLGRLLRAEHRDLAAVPDHLAHATAARAFAPGLPGAMRWQFEQRARRLVAAEARVFRMFGVPLFLPMLDRTFTEFWGRVPENLLIQQRAFRHALARHLFSGQAVHLADIPCEGASHLMDFEAPRGLRRFFRRLRSRRLRKTNPVAYCVKVAADPNVQWWAEEAALRQWAARRLGASETVRTLMRPDALARFLERDTLTTYEHARTSVWNLLTIAGVETALRSGTGSSVYP